MNLFSQAKDDGSMSSIALAKYMKKYGEKLHPTVYQNYKDSSETDDANGWTASRMKLYLSNVPCCQNQKI